MYLPVYYLEEAVLGNSRKDPYLVKATEKTPSLSPDIP